MLVDIAAFIPACVRLHRLAGKLAHRHEFMPACRIFSTVTYHMRFRRLLSGSRVKAAFVANQYSPECLGLASAAHRSGRKVLFTNHANATGETGYVPPIHADLLAVTSQALADLYRRHTPHDLNIVPTPVVLPQHAMRVPAPDATGLVAGIYLTALTDEARLRRLVAELSGLPSVGSVFVRTHPAEIVNADLSDMTGAHGPVEVSRPRRLQDDIGRTDFAVCGNSTVVTEILRGGRPVLYDHRLDRIAYDYNGYAGHGLVPACPETICPDFIDRIRRHYSRPDWSETMRYFDSSYQQDETAMMKRVEKAVQHCLRQA